MARKAHFDSGVFEPMDAADMKGETYMIDTTEGTAVVNKATPMPTGRDINMAANAALNSNRSTGGCTTSNQFNIIGGVIGQAAIGNTGPVTFNQQKKVFKKGASHSQYDISGGNFSQANIGGRSVYNNDGSTVSAGNGTKVTPEDLAILILEKGVTKDEFTKLLEENYSLSQIAFAIPNNATLKNRMIRALLNTA